MGAWIEIARTVSQTSCSNWSHPSWVRGLKSISRPWRLLIRVCRTLHGCVDWNKMASCRWPMTWRRTLHGCVDWNSDCHYFAPLNLLSHPSWVRGLKLGRKERGQPVFLRRTLHGCVDWNSVIQKLLITAGMSHPSWVRGLKSRHWISIGGKSMSHPSWVRGLK